MSLNSLFSQHEDLHLISECFELDSETKGLTKYFKDRTHLLPAADNALIGIAIGMAMDGAKVIVQLAEADSLWGILGQLGQETESSFSLPIIIRVPVPPTATIQWTVLESLNVQVWCPRSKSQLYQSIEAGLTNAQPTIILEPLLALQQEDAQQLLPAEKLTDGEDVSLFVWGDSAHTAIQAVKDLEEDAIFVEVIALNQLMPISSSLIAESVAKTGRPVFVNPPKMLLQHIIDGAFWSLETQPLTAANSYQNIKQNVLESLR